MSSHDNQHKSRIECPEHYHDHTEDANKEPIIALCDIGLRIGRRDILKDVNFTVYKDDFVAITGPNGGGKTTMLRIILDLIKPSTGKVWVKPGAKIGYLPQKNTIDSHFPISVREVVDSGLLSVKGLSKAQRQAKVEETIRQIELEERADQPIGELSGGQLQRALLGRAIISDPQVLVLDEPLSYIDKRFEQHLYEIISRIAKNATILLVSHEMSIIASMANRHLIIDGTLHECSASHHYIHTDCDE